MLATAIPAWSAGIAVMEQSVKELGQAFSGAPSNIDDGSMVFFNPGAMSQVRGRLVSVAGYAIAPSAVFHDNASHLSPLLGGVPLKGGNGGDSPNLVSVRHCVLLHTLRYIAPPEALCSHTFSPCQDHLGFRVPYRRMQ